jgi:hypothetical protein
MKRVPTIVALLALSLGGLMARASAPVRAGDRRHNDKYDSLVAIGSVHSVASTRWLIAN